MRLRFVYMPTRDLKAAVRFYRDVLGWEEAWREGETTAGMRMPGTDVQLLLDQDEDEIPQAGPFFEVDSVDRFYAENRDRLPFVIAPKDIPPGRYAAFTDPSGNVVRVYDHSKDS